MSEQSDMTENGSTEQDYLEDNISTVAFHLGAPGARLSVTNDISGLVVDPGEVLKEVSRRLTRAPAASGSDAVAAELEFANEQNIKAARKYKARLDYMEEKYGAIDWDASTGNGAVAVPMMQNRDDTLRGLAEFFSESIHTVWSNDEIAHCLTEMIGHGSKESST